jgi:hypothetical protein
MGERAINDILDWKIFESKKVCVEEVLPQNIDFLLLEMSNALDGAPIFTFNQTAEHYERLAMQHNKRVAVRSAYDSEYIPSLINDDVWTAENIHGIRPEGRFFAYRSSTCSKLDYYKYDIIVRVEPLSSGISSKIDGSIKVFDRHRKYHEFKYKTARDRVLYLP